MGYHITDIPKGKYGKYSKVIEEMHEIIDSLEQGIKPMVLIEICDCIGALRGLYREDSFQSIIDTTHIYAEYDSSLTEEEIIKCFIADLLYFMKLDDTYVETSDILQCLLSFTEYYFRNSISKVDLMSFVNKTSEIKESMNYDK